MAGSILMGIERFTDRSNKVMELALREALQLGCSYVAPEHILLGLLREGESVAAEVLVVDAGLSLSDVRRAVIVRLTSPPTKAKLCAYCGEEIEPWTFSPHSQNPGKGWRHVGTGARQCQVTAEPA